MPASAPEFEILFVDMDAYFAAVEQMDNPQYRGKPLGVTPVMAPTGCCIATSYPARRMGAKTGCSVREAKRLCPDITIVPARPDRYIEVHHAILDAIDSVIQVTEIESVDECWCRLLANERSPETVQAIARGIKSAIDTRVGPISCSIGVAPNRLLAKVAAGMQKPDGFTVIGRSELPGPLLDLGLTDFPGISKGINRRLRAAGIYSTADLYARSSSQLRSAWGSVLGVYWWHWLRGDQLLGPKTHRRTVGHQHVLDPKLRAQDRARGVSLRLLSKATQRMRSLGYVATRLSLSLERMGASGWGDWTPVARTDDTVELAAELLRLWSDAPSGDLLQVGVRLEGLEPTDTQLPLFPQERSRRALMEVIDLINRRGGADTIYLGSMHNERGSAPRRIPFGKPPDLALPDWDGV